MSMTTSDPGFGDFAEMEQEANRQEARTLTGSAKEIASVCDELKAMLLEKNRAYGDSALNPVRVFSKAPTDEQIRVRLDDKLSRLQRGEAAGEDPEWDLMGYLVLLRVAKRREKK